MCTSLSMFKFTMIHGRFAYVQTEDNMFVGPYFPLKKCGTKCIPNHEITSGGCNATCPQQGQQAVVFLAVDSLLRYPLHPSVQS